MMMSYRQAVKLVQVVRFGNTVMHRSRQGAGPAKEVWLVRLEKFGTSERCRDFHNTANCNEFKDECHRIYETFPKQR